MNDPKFTCTRSAFEMICSVAITIRAQPDGIWKLLTDAPGFPSWNSTVFGIEGEIREGGKLRIRVPASSRTFTPTVSDVASNRKMIWSDGFAPMFKGVRTFELKPAGGATDFEMRERFSGLMLPLIKGSLPDFGPIFERYATDLKIAAERAG